MDLRAGAERPLARVVQVFGQAHHGFLFANARVSSVKLLVHDGFGVWRAARRLNTGHFLWPKTTGGNGATLTLTQQQFEALAVGLPWQRLANLGSALFPIPSTDLVRVFAPPFP